MNIVLYGATGMIGSRILAEALRRGHTVTAIARDVSSLTPQIEMHAVRGNILDTGDVARQAAGKDAVVSAFSPGRGPASVYLDVAHSLLAGLRTAGVTRLVLVGGAGSLEVAPGLALVDSPSFPAAYKERAEGQRSELNFYRTEATDLDWTYFSPAMMIGPGERTGVFRLGSDQLLSDAKGQSHISAEDYAVALVDELKIRSICGSGLPLLIKAGAKKDHAQL